MGEKHNCEKARRFRLGFRLRFRAGSRLGRAAISAAAAAALSGAVLFAAPGAALAQRPSARRAQPVASTPFLDTLHTVTRVASTVPANGDVNPYGIVSVSQSVGDLRRSSTLVSNFNASSNLQGTGTTIVEVTPRGRVSVFAHIERPLPGSCPGGVGLTTALAILSDGYVVVGSLPVTDAGSGNPEAGCLIVLDPSGAPVETWSGTLIDGPWDMAVVNSPGSAQLFVTNVLNGTVAAGGKPVSGGTVVRLDVSLPTGAIPQLVSETVVGTGFSEQLNAAALVVGPTGVAVGSNGDLYVADTVNNRIAEIPDATERTTPIRNGALTVTSGGGLDAPLGMALAPDGDVIVANGGNGNAVEVTPSGDQVADVEMDPLDSGGDLFGLEINPSARAILFVDDGDNALERFGP